MATAGQVCATAGLALSRAQLFQRSRAFALTDALTGLTNRRGFDELMERLNGPDPTAYSLALVDVDHFKAVNDNHGHQVGDEVLSQISRALSSAAPPGVMVARFGGEEFAIVMPQIPISTALQIAEQMRGSVEALKQPLPVTVSLGVAGSLVSATGAGVIAAADRALYQAKHGGRNQVVAASLIPAQTVPTDPAGARSS
jgi:diguanylate cyclase (GGDEF)-like protein